MHMRSKLLVSAVALLTTLAGLSEAQEQKNSDELRKLYDESVAQLKAAQDRKNKLDRENEKLALRLAELEVRLAERDAEAAQYAERTWTLRAQSAAWERFIERYPEWKTRWEAFLTADLFDPTAELAIRVPPAPVGR